MGHIVTKLTKPDWAQHWIECWTMSDQRSSGEDSGQAGITLFTDVADDSGLADRHREVAIDVLQRIGGVEGNALRGGIVATFDDANRALICAVQIQRSFEDWGSSSTAPIRVSICRVDEDAVAIAGQVGGGEILVTESVRALTEPRGYLFTARGEGQPAETSVPLFAVRWWEHD